VRICNARNGFRKPPPFIILQRKMTATVEARGEGAYLWGESRRIAFSDPFATAMSDRSEFEALLTQNLEWVRRAAAKLCRRNRVTAPDEIEDFVGWVCLRLVEDDYSVLRKFRRESAITTYLTVVIAMLFRDYRVKQWGRWRPSAAAKRMGSLAVQLETLVYRDGYRVDQAGEILRSEGHAVQDAELVEMLRTLPPHAPPRPMPVGEESLETFAGPSAADQDVLAEETAGERRTAEDALRAALEGLSEEDRTIVRLRIWEGMSVADIARVLHLPQKPLYRRLERIFAELRRQLERAGVDAEQVRRIFDELDE